MATLATIDDEAELKKQFAADVLAEVSVQAPHLVSQRMFPNDFDKQREVSHLWPSDPIVRVETERLTKANTALAYLPDKAATARKAWQLIAEGADQPQKVSALKVYADLMGFIEKPSTVVNNNATQFNSGVLIVREQSPEDWEKGVFEQQRKLEAECARATAVTLEDD